MKRLFKSKIAILKLEPDEDEAKDKANVSKKANEPAYKNRNNVKKLKKIINKDKTPLREDNSDFSVIERLDEDLIIEKEWLPVSEDTKWKCIRCGWCCQQNWRINMTWREYDRIIKYLSVTEIVVDEEAGTSHPVYTINGKCEKYNKKTHRCEIYRNRLYTCAAFPFILEVNDEILRSKYCKGFGSGEIVDKQKMKKYLVKLRKKAGLE